VHDRLRRAPAQGTDRRPGEGDAFEDQQVVSCNAAHLAALNLHDGRAVARG
jgi:hypothetical protein